MKFKKAIRLLTDFMPNAEELEKPTLLHSVRIGIYLYSNGYKKEICIGGLLHDAIEDTKVTYEDIKSKFGKEIADIVLVNTKNESLENKYEDQISRCVGLGESSLIVKAADILDNHFYYKHINETEGLKYVYKVSKILLDSKPDSFQDPIFEKLNSIIGN